MNDEQIIEYNINIARGKLLIYKTLILTATDLANHELKISDEKHLEKKMIEWTNDIKSEYPSSKPEWCIARAWINRITLICWKHARIHQMFDYMNLPRDEHHRTAFSRMWLEIQNACFYCSSLYRGLTEMEEFFNTINEKSLDAWIVNGRMMLTSWWWKNCTEKQRIMIQKVNNLRTEEFRVRFQDAVPNDWSMEKRFEAAWKFCDTNDPF